MNRRLLALSMALVLFFLAACGPAAKPMLGSETAIQATIITEPSTLAPREWLGVPEVYWAVLDYAAAFGQHHSSWPTTHFTLADINGDGVEELVLAQYWASNNSSRLHAIHTQRNGKAYNLVTAPGIYLNISTDGIVYKYIVSGSSAWFFETYRLEPNATELSPVTSITIFNDNGRFTIGERNAPMAERRELTNDEFYTYIVYGPPHTPASPMQFNFIPLELLYD